jgi:hypothetical protein
MYAKTVAVSAVPSAHAAVVATSAGQRVLAKRLAIEKWVTE